MKKACNLFMTIMILGMTLALTACTQEKAAAEDSTKGGKENSQNDHAQSTQNESEVSLPVSYDYKAQYIRTNGYHSDVTYPLAFLIDSRAALEKYYTDNVERYDFAHKDTVYSDTTIGFEDAIQKYDDKWFETHRLILAVLEEGSGSNRHKVANVSRTAENDIAIEITRYLPEIGTADMAEWHVLIEMDRDDLQMTDQFQVTFTEDDRLVWLTSEECEKIQNMLSSIENYGFLHSSYTSPENIKWSEVFYGGAGIATQELPEQEKQDYLEAVGSSYSYGDLFKITSKQLEEFVKEKTNSSYQDALRPLEWTYLEPYDAYYATYWDTNIDSYQCLTGIRIGDTLKLRVKKNMINDWEPEEIYELVLQEKPDGSYHFVSNRLLWEEGRIAEQSFFNVELSEYDSPVHVMIYPPMQEDSGKFVIRMIKDDEVVQQITPWLPDGVEDSRLISMDAVAFPDYDMDGDTDMILIYTIEGGRVIDILDGYNLKNLSWQSDFEHNLDLANALMQRTEEELNMANVKKFLGYKGKGEKFSSWQEAYCFIARLENIQESRYQYNLIYFDEDEVPELVVDLPGYRAIIYTYADGHLYRLMDGWGYGVLGNNGYQYLPSGNKMFNRDYDYAGAIYFDTIIRMNSDHRLEDVVTIFTVNFDDKNGDGYPEEDEEQTIGEVSTSYIDGRAISEEEYASYFADAEETEWISGEYGYEELLGKLAVDQTKPAVD